ncbi:hypothetical protein ACFLRW_03525 [Acidobacteriota bacterium]
MKRLSSELILLFLFTCFFFCACPKPTVPELPEEKVRFGLNWYISEFKIDMDNWNRGFNNIWVSFLVRISEDDYYEIRANIESVKASLYIGNKLKVEETQAGGTIPRASELQIEFNLQVWGPDYKVDKLIVEFKGEDDNGYLIDEKKEKIISWDESSAIMIQ